MYFLLQVSSSKVFTPVCCLSWRQNCKIAAASSTIFIFSLEQPAWINHFFVVKDKNTFLKEKNNHIQEWTIRINRTIINPCFIYLLSYRILPVSAFLCSNVTNVWGFRTMLSFEHAFSREPTGPMQKKSSWQVFLYSILSFLTYQNAK